MAVRGATAGARGVAAAGTSAGRAASRAGHATASAAATGAYAVASGIRTGGTAAARMAVRGARAGAHGVAAAGTATGRAVSQAGQATAGAAATGAYFTGGVALSGVKAAQRGIGSLGPRGARARASYAVKSRIFSPTHAGMAKSELAAHTSQLKPEAQLARENLLNLINLRGKQLGADEVSEGVDTRSLHSTAARTSETDVNIHGTFAHGGPWVKEGSAFTTASTAGRDTSATSFQWSGGGREKDRVAAGKSLGAFLGDVKNPFISGEQTRINAVAHSHGGNVLGKALSEAGTTGVQAAVMLGTPQMTRSGVNTSWSTAGADKVAGEIFSLHDKADRIQTAGARGNEFSLGNIGLLSRGPRLKVGREFSSPSATPQHNIEVETKRGIVATVSPAKGAAAHGQLHDGDAMSGPAPVGTRVNEMLRASNTRATSGTPLPAGTRTRSKTVIDRR